MDETAQAKPARQTPGKMTTFIGKWDAEGAAAKTFTVLAEISGATDKDVKAAITKLGYGTYDIVTGRCSDKKYLKVERDAFA